MQAILEVKDLYKRFGGLEATKHVDFTLYQGEILGILGPNGAGKTTLFNQLAGAYAPTSGKVFFKGEDITGLKSYIIANKGIARTFQIPKPFAEMTLLENVYMSCLAKRVQKAVGGKVGARKWAMEVLEMVELAAKADQKVDLLTHGELKKLEMAKALALKPEVILLDEPFAGLGIQEVDPISNMIKRLNKEKGLTVIIIEHKLREFMKLAERVIALNYGEKIAEGTPKEIINNPLIIEAYLGKGGAALANAGN